MKITELFEAADPSEERTRKDFTANPRHVDRSDYDENRSQKLGVGGTLATEYNTAVENANKGNHKKLDDLIIASIIASTGFDRALIDRSVSLEDALRRDVKVGIVRGKNFGTYQEQKTINGYITNGGNLDNVIVSSRDIVDETGKATGKKENVDARQYWTSRYNKRTTSPMINSKMWLHTEHSRINSVIEYLNATSSMVSAKRISELLNLIKTIEKFEAKPEFDKGRKESRKIQQADNIEKLNKQKSDKDKQKEKDKKKQPEVEIA